MIKGHDCRVVQSNTAGQLIRAQQGEGLNERKKPIIMIIMIIVVLAAGL
jgi:hypothetical protein